MNKSRIFFFLSGIFLLSFFLSGCALVIQKGRRSDLEKIESLKNELSELRSTKSVLEKRLSEEIKDKEVKLEMKDKGLVITVLTEVLFDSGKDVLRESSYPILDKVAKVLNREALGHQVGIEGHTDNVPIKYSGWKSNWELSSHRALNVLHYMAGKGVSPDRLSAVGYGQYRPVASNDSEEGRQLNRRVEIVILPRLVKKLNIPDNTGVEKKSTEEILK